MGVSLREYARHRGVSPTAVEKAIVTGRIVPLDDGTLDPAIADEEWKRNTRPYKKSPAARSQSALPGIEPPKKNIGTQKLNQAHADIDTGALESADTTLLQARTANEIVKAQTGKVRLSQLKGDLIDRNAAVSHVFKLARTERDAWLNWPSRIVSPMAMQLGIDQNLLYSILEAEVREHLRELGQLRVVLDG